MKNEKYARAHSANIKRPVTVRVVYFLTGLWHMNSVKLIDWFMQSHIIGLGLYADCMWIVCRFYLGFM